MRYGGEKNFNDFFKFLSDCGLCDTLKFVSDTDFNRFLKDIAPINLPKAYLDFMRYAGYGGFFVGSDYGIHKAKHLNGYAKELLEENDFPHKLGENDFVFFMHQGYAFYFFNLAEGENPPVYYYNECENQTDFVKCYDSFTDFIIEPFISGVPRPL